MPTTPVITYNGNQRTVSYNISDEQQAARAAAEAKALAGGATAVEADAAGNAAGNLAGAAALKKVGENIASDDDPYACTPNAVATNPTTPTVNNPNTNSQKAGTKSDPKSSPGARKVNPLSSYSSYTYAISLSICTAEYFNQWRTSTVGTLPRENNNVFIVAQDGGIYNQASSRALTASGTPGKGPGLDYYIEDVQFTSVLPNKSGNSVGMQDIKFKIVEPMGFTFLHKLNLACVKINQSSKLATSSATDPNNKQASSLEQVFLLTVKFYGYDSTGKIVTPSTTQPNGGSSNSDPLSITERTYALKISELTFKLSGKTTVYEVTAYLAEQQVAGSQSVGIIKSAMTLSGLTVGDLLIGSKGSGSLMDRLNESASVEATKGYVDKPTKYEISFTPDAIKYMKDAKILSNLDKEQPRTSSMNEGSTTDKNNVKKQFTSDTISLSNNIAIPAGTDIYTAIDNIIVKSSYISDALKKTNTSGAETESVKNASSTPLRWYTINPTITIDSYDQKRGDWTYKINYQIGTYDVSYIRTQYANSLVPYPGAYKVYDYYYTGQNTEVLEFEQTFNNLYYAITSMSVSPESLTVKDARQTGTKNSPQNSTTSDSTSGGLFKTNEINQNVKAQLLSELDGVTATIKIIGDPDYITTTPGALQTGQSAEAASKYYGIKGYDMNPYQSQIFIEINFKLAEDYQNNGLLDVNDLIQFYDIAAVSASKAQGGAGIKGIVYTVQSVTSSFSHGMFTQQLQLVLVPSNMLAVKGQDGAVSTIGANGTGAPDPNGRSDSGSDTTASGDGGGGGSGSGGGGGAGGDVRGTQQNQLNQQSGDTSTGTSKPAADPGYDQALLDRVAAEDRAKRLQQNANDDQVTPQQQAQFESIDTRTGVTPNGATVGETRTTSGIGNERNVTLTPEEFKKKYG